LRLEFRPTSKLSDTPIKPPEHIRAVETEQSNSTALVDNDYVSRSIEKLVSGINPEIEIGRFLTEVAGFANTPALLAASNWSKAATEVRSRLFTPSSRIRATPGP